MKKQVVPVVARMALESLQLASKLGATKACRSRSRRNAETIVDAAYWRAMERLMHDARRNGGDKTGSFLVWIALQHRRSNPDLLDALERRFTEMPGVSVKRRNVKRRRGVGANTEICFVVTWP